MRLTEDDARARFGSVRSATLATIGADGAPQLVPITFAVEDGLVYTVVDFKPKSSPRLRRLDNIAADPRVALLTDQYSDDWSRLWWVRAVGRATVLTDAAQLRHPVDVLVARYEQYQARRPEGPVIAIRVERWAGWSASCSRPGAAGGYSSIS